MPSNQRGTGYTNLQQYLGLNQGSAQRMGDALAGDVEEKGNAFKNSLNTATVGLQDKLRAAGDFGITNPSGVTADQAAQYGAKQWTGPEGFDAATMNDLYSKGTAAQNAANATGTNEGRQTLLGQHYGPTTWGGGALDAALAGAGGASGRLSAAQGAYGRLVSSLGGIQQNAQDTATAAKNDFNQTAAYWRGQAPQLQQQKDERDAYNLEYQRQNRNKYTGGGWKNNRSDNRPSRDAGAAYTP